MKFSMQWVIDRGSGEQEEDDMMTYSSAYQSRSVAKKDGVDVYQLFQLREMLDPQESTVSVKCERG